MCVNVLFFVSERERMKEHKIGEKLREIEGGEEHDQNILSEKNHFIKNC